MNVIPHLQEIRTRLIRVLIIFTGCFVLLFFQANSLYQLLAKPLLTYLPVGGHLIATEVTTPFLVPMKLSFVLTILLTVPMILTQIWKFIAPGLYLQERKKIFPIIAISCLLFYCGISFGFLVICPLALKFFANAAPANVVVMTDISHYFDFICQVCLAAGFAFQIPLVTHVLLRTGLVEKKALIAKRPYVIVAAFFLGMLLTPPDVVSQILLALPIWGLFELGLVTSREIESC